MIVGFAALFEEPANGLRQRGLVFFNGKHIVSRALIDKIVGLLALGQERIGRECFPRDVQGIDERDKHPDFVGLLKLVAAFYGQGADFFWAWQVWV